MLHAKSTRLDTRLDRLGRMAPVEAKVVRVHQVNGVLVRFEGPPALGGLDDLEAPPDIEVIEAGLQHVSMLGLDGQHQAVVIRPKSPTCESGLSGPSLALDVHVVDRLVALPEADEPPASSLPPRSEATRDDSRPDGLLKALTVLVGLGGLVALVAAVGIGDERAGLGALCGAAGLILGATVLVALELRGAILDLMNGDHPRTC